MSRRTTGKQRGHLVTALLFLLPLIAFYGIYYLYSFVFLARISTERVSLTFVGAVDVGWENFRLVVTDPVFLTSLVNTFAFAGIAIVAGLTVGFVLAIILATGVRGRKVFYAIFLIPSLIPLSLFATVFGQMLETQDGAFNRILRAIGLGGLQQEWLSNTGPAYVAVAILLVYLVGLPIMYYTSDIPAANLDLVEAALLDGAGPWQIFRLILFPLLRTTHITVILSVLLGSFRAFDLIYFSTGGAPGGRTNIVGVYIYNATLGHDRVGYAAAASVIVLIVALSISAVQMFLTRRGADRV
ncbi:MAG: carbohydrate ABC transporter permease [Nostocoides sp.]